MLVSFMASYVSLLIYTCHKRGVHAMGGMSAFIPVNNDEQANNAALEKVKADKLREVKAGCDGTWVAHPGLIPVAQKVFDQYMSQPNQINTINTRPPITSTDLLTPPTPLIITMKGIVDNIDIGLEYLESWLRGVGCVPIHGLVSTIFILSQLVFLFSLSHLYLPFFIIDGRCSNS